MVSGYPSKKSGPGQCPIRMNFLQRIVHWQIPAATSAKPAHSGTNTEILQTGHDLTSPNSPRFGGCRPAEAMLSPNGSSPSAPFMFLKDSKPGSGIIFWPGPSQATIRRLRFRRRARLFDDKDEMRKLRMRIAHHEPILAGELAEDHERIHQFIEWRRPDVAV